METKITSENFVAAAMRTGTPPGWVGMILMAMIISALRG